MYGVTDTHEHAFKQQDDLTVIKTLLLADTFAVAMTLAAAEKQLAGRNLSDAGLTALWGLGAWPDALMPLLCRSLQGVVRDNQDPARKQAAQRLVQQALNDLQEV